MGKDETAAASALAKSRWKNTTKAERTEVAQDMNKARWGDKTPAERAAHGAMLAAARAKAKKKASAKKGKT